MTRSQQHLHTLGFFIVQAGQSRKYSYSTRGQGDDDHPAVFSILRPMYEPVLYRSFHQPHYRMMPLLQKFREFGNGGAAAAGVTSHAQQQLVLLRGYAALACCIFAKAQKLAQRVAKPRKITNNGVWFIPMPIGRTLSSSSLRAHNSNYIALRPICIPGVCDNRPKAMTLKGDGQLSTIRRG